MEREEIKARIVEHLRRHLALLDNPSTRGQQLQMGSLYDLFSTEINGLPQWKQSTITSVVAEVVHEFANNGLIYFGNPGSMSSHDYFPWITITARGKEVFGSEDWLPHDSEGYVKALKAKVPELDDVTLAYIGESVGAFNRRHLLAATITLGVASENIMLLLIEAYRDWIKDPKHKAAFEKKTEGRWIATQYSEFKKAFSIDVKALPKHLQGDWETYLDGVFNFIRLNRNSAGHPTGKELSAKVVNANLQIFAEYARYIHNLIAALK
jgi:hypothetical protein